MRRAPVLRYVAAVPLSAAAGALCLAVADAAIEAAEPSPGPIAPSETFYLVLIYSFLLSLPVVALALPLAGAAVNRLAPSPGLNRLVLTLGMGVLAGIAIASLLVPSMVPGAEAWLGPLAGTLWGGASSIIGLMLVPAPAESGADHG